LRAIIAITPEGKYRVLAERYDGKKFNSPNDVMVGPDGAQYFADPTLDLVAGEKQEIPFQGVYRLDDGGNVRLLTRDLTQPNGLAFSPDGKTFYVDDSEQRNIRAYDVAADETLWNGAPSAMSMERKTTVFPTGSRSIGRAISLLPGRKVFGCGMRKAITSVLSSCRNSRRI
jgi:gluconolactonase